MPVDNIDDFVREDGYDGNNLQDFVSSGKATEPNASSPTEVAEYNAMYESVEKYGGFYIARYEASKKEINGTEIAQSIANQEPWTEIIWGENNITPGTEGAVGKSRALYPEKNATLEKDAVSTLIYGVQWDATVRFLEKNYPGISKNATGKGNAVSEGRVDAIIKTGSNTDYAQNNIYDLCGNVFEWTMEAYEANMRLNRAAVPTDLLYRYRCAPNTDYEILGFRVALYIK